MDFAINFVAQWVALFAIIAVLVLARQVQLRIGWLVVAVAFFAIAVTALVWLGDFIPLQRWFGPLQWNWGGKIVGIAASLLMVAGLWLFARKPPRESGLTLRMERGSIVPALLVSVLMVGATIGLEVLAQDGTDTSPERLLYQATMPGLDEELFWRGVFLLAMNEALRGGRFGLGGAELSWAGVLVSLLFGLVHGVQYSEGAFSVSWLVIGITGVIGFGLYWLRARTGSIVIPIIVHNVINVSGSFF